MEYNTARNKLVIREYGRNVQKMIEYALTIEDKEERSDFAKAIVNVMAQMNPSARDSGDIRHKLWDHLFIISNFKLEVDSPFEAPSPYVLKQKPKRLKYQDNNIEFRHYGKNIVMMIEKAILYDEGKEKDALVMTIANHMKKSYLNWNRESVNDELIAEHLRILSKGRLELKEDQKLNNTNEILARNRKRKTKKDSNSTNNGGGRNRKDKK
jgi:hypothetical protein